MKARSTKATTIAPEKHRVEAGGLVVSRRDRGSEALITMPNGVSYAISVSERGCLELRVVNGPHGSVRTRLMIETLASNIIEIM